KLQDGITIGLKLAEAGRGVNAENGSQSTLLYVESVFVGEADVGEPVAVSHREPRCPTQIPFRGTGDSGASHGQLASVGQSDLPILVVIDRMHHRGVSLKLHGEVAVHRSVV